MFIDLKIEKKINDIIYKYNHNMSSYQFNYSTLSDVEYIFFIFNQY